MKSAECTQALEALQAQEAALRSAARQKGAGEEAAERADLKAIQARAARECLGGGSGAEPLVQRPLRPPVAVGPVTLLPHAVPVVPAVPPAVAPPIRIPPLRTVTRCDPAGCWASDGTRLDRLGPLLLEPRGTCTVHSGVLSCN